MLRKGDEMTVEDLNVHDRGDRIYVEVTVRGSSPEPELKFPTGSDAVDFDSVRDEIERALNSGGQMTVRNVHTEEGRMDTTLEHAGWQWNIEMDWFRHRA